MSTGANPSTKKRKYKPRNPPGPDRVAIGWKEEEFQNLVRDMGFLPEWDAQFPTPKSTALDAPLGYIALYAAFIREGNFCLPMTKFTVEVLTNYGLHISQINALGLPRLTHFEFICKANRIEPTFEMFNVFYNVSYTGGFYSFNSRTSGVIPCSSNPPKSVHDWKQKFFYIRRGVIPALVGAGMSMLCIPKNPKGIPIYGYQGKVGYSLLNVLDTKAGGAVIEAIQPEGRVGDRRGEDDEDDFDDTTDPTRDEVIVLSSEGSDRSLEGLIPHSARAGPAQGAANEPVNEPVGDDADPPVETAEQLETLKKKKLDKSEKKEKKVEENVTKTPSKRPSTLPFLDYVVVSDTLSGLGTGGKCTERDPEDDETLTEIVRKRKVLEDKKRELDEQAAAALAAKKSKLQKETSPAPSESED
ncbi:hypothetical protein HanPI659440_Chr09g0342491 [Helianthus annuus]|nr:hypothetical protein HanPI659440_Chr09g0342491 [Helianthus annuus]